MSDPPSHLGGFLASVVRISRLPCYEIRLFRIERNLAVDAASPHDPADCVRKKPFRHSHLWPAADGSTKNPRFHRSPRRVSMQQSLLVRLLPAFTAALLISRGHQCPCRTSSDH